MCRLERVEEEKNQKDENPSGEINPSLSQACFLKYQYQRYFETLPESKGS